jgi:uncharacterized protein (DUF433 family)
MEGSLMRREQIITWDKDILGGTPVFTGTRVPVDTLVAHIKAGDSLEKFLDDFPSVSRDQAIAFLELAQELVIHEARDAHSA